MLILAFASPGVNDERRVRSMVMAEHILVQLEAVFFPLVLQVEATELAFVIVAALPDVVGFLTVHTEHFDLGHVLFVNAVERQHQLVPAQVASRLHLAEQVDGLADLQVGQFVVS